MEEYLEIWFCNKSCALHYFAFRAAGQSRLGNRISEKLEGKKRENSEK